MKEGRRGEEGERGGPAEGGVGMVCVWQTGGSRGTRLRLTGRGRMGPSARGEKGRCVAGVEGVKRGMEAAGKAVGKVK